MISNLAGTNSDKNILTRVVSSRNLLLKRQSTKDWIIEIHEELKRQAIEKKTLNTRYNFWSAVTQKSSKMISNLASGTNTSAKITRNFSRNYLFKRQQSSMDWIKDIHEGLRQANKPLLCLFAQFQLQFLILPFKGAILGSHTCTALI